MTDLEEAEAQHSRALSGHLRNLDRLLQLQRCRLRCMEEGCSAQLEDLQEEFEAERYCGAAVLQRSADQRGGGVGVAAGPPVQYMEVV